MKRSIAYITILAALLSCDSVENSSSPQLQGEFWVDSLSITIKYEYDALRDNHGWFAHYRYIYRLNYWDGDLNTHEIYPDPPGNFGIWAHGDCFCGCPDPANTTLEEKGKIGLSYFSDYDYSAHDSISVIFKASGEFERCSKRWGPREDFEILGRFEWTDTVMATVIQP